MYSKPRLLHIGLWAGYFGIFPHPRQLLKGGIEEPEREKVALYIEQSPMAEFAGRNFCSTCKSLLDGVERYTLGLRSDGRWIYPDGLCCFVRRGIDLPDAFLDHVRSANYVPPENSIDYRNYSDDGGLYWVAWTLFHSRWTWMSLVHWVKLVVFLPLLFALWPFCRSVRLP